MDGTNLHGTLLLTGRIDTARIWADEPAPPPANAGQHARRHGADRRPAVAANMSSVPTSASRPRKARYAATVQRVQRTRRRACCAWCSADRRWPASTGMVRPRISS